MQVKVLAQSLAQSKHLIDETSGSTSNRAGPRSSALPGQRPLEALKAQPVTVGTRDLLVKDLETQSPHCVLAQHHLHLGPSVVTAASLGAQHPKNVLQG